MKIETTKYGLKHDPRGAHCTMRYRDRLLIGEIMSVYRNETRGMLHLKVNHFNGDSWPLDPHVSAVDVLEREYEAV